jgi:hypothetical protein
MSPMLGSFALQRLCQVNGDAREKISADFVSLSKKIAAGARGGQE